MKKQKLYWQLFSSTFYLSAFTFGGGFVIVPLMRKKFVKDLQWIEEKEMMDLTAIAQSSPGAIAVNASIIIGYRIAGFLGALIATLGTVLPPLLIISVISIFYTQFRDNELIQALLKGMQAGVAAIIVDVVFTLSFNIIKTKRISSIIIMILAFISSYFLNINVIYIILLSGLIGVISLYNRVRKEKKNDLS
jgi:chromate transporter